MYWAELDLDSAYLMIGRGVFVTAANKAGDPASADVVAVSDCEPEAGEEHDSR
jgi:hypothetical protein